MLQVRHADMLALVEAAIRGAKPDLAEDFDVEADHCLVTDLGFDGRHVQHLFELLEEALGLVLPAPLAFDLARKGPTVGRLTRELNKIREDRRHAA